MPLVRTESGHTAEDYWALPEGQRAELIDGVLYDMAPPSRVHQAIALGIAADLLVYVRSHGGPCKVYNAPFAVNLNADESTWLEPDVVVVCDASKLSERGCEGAPDLVVEVVSPSSVQMDYFVKAARYERAGVGEYWIVDPLSQRVAVYRFGAESPRLSTYTFDEDVPVGLFRGLTLRVSSYL